MFDKNEKSASLEIFLDEDFEGTMYGLPEESLGCKLGGKVVLNNTKAIQAKYLLFVFAGKIIVACGPPMSSSRPEYSEIKTIFRKECLFHDSATSNKKIPAGTHEYYFEFELPGNLPSSFKGSRGKIEYYCTAVLSRPIFRNDLIVKKIVNIKRCLMDETRAAQTHHTTFTEGILDEKIHYQISTPIMTFREGGLVQNELILKSDNIGTAIEAIEYGLKEHIHYHTTGEEATAGIANVNEERYPLGKRRIKIDPDSNDGDPIMINFRLCPWVNCDVNSELIDVIHKLSFTICVTEAVNLCSDNESVLSEATNRRSSRRISFGRNPNRRHSSRTMSLSNLSNIINSQRNTLVSKVERKRLHFEIPIIVTTKSIKPSQESLSDTLIDRPPSYAIASMVSPPPEYVDIGMPEFSTHENLETDYVVYDLL
ncbi:hypothetical protein RirG_012650 [Rhizophagus irregularis DAOM 197198w]|uniref:Arrestin-like N-terminal domain-containing protein n=1 Tax=Rhizophagus irregularis (strain DAOM 197198w) TaxID=1432141 RepID=A0A015KGG0_RHIIW|nr:hypothetical protein RirG_012650 [Rhizophagus irregularis DAOM 197198w]